MSTERSLGLKAVIITHSHYLRLGAEENADATVRLACKAVVPC